MAPSGPHTLLKPHINDQSLGWPYIPYIQWRCGTMSAKREALCDFLYQKIAEDKRLALVDPVHNFPKEGIWVLARFSRVCFILWSPRSGPRSIGNIYYSRSGLRTIREWVRRANEWVFVKFWSIRTLPGPPSIIFPKMRSGGRAKIKLLKYPFAVSTWSKKFRLLEILKVFINRLRWCLVCWNFVLPASTKNNNPIIKKVTNFLRRRR